MTSFPSPLPYSEDVEAIPADEADDIRRVLDALQDVLRQALKKTGEFRSDVHVKVHGCAVGDFRVLPNLPEELAQGLFERGATYPVTVRFSNSAPRPQPDAVPDGRGLAIQLRDVS